MVERLLRNSDRSSGEKTSGFFWIVFILQGEDVSIPQDSIYTVDWRRRQYSSGQYLYCRLEKTVCTMVETCQQVQVGRYRRYRRYRSGLGRWNASLSCFKISYPASVLRIDILYRSKSFNQQSLVVRKHLQTQFKTQLYLFLQLDQKIPISRKFTMKKLGKHIFYQSYLSKDLRVFLAPFSIPA